MNEIRRIDLAEAVLKENNNNRNEKKSNNNASRDQNPIEKSEVSKLWNEYEETELNKTERIPNMDVKIDKIISRLYLSNDSIAKNKYALDKYKITHILNLTTNIPNKFEPEITYLKMIILDFESQNISQYFNEAFEFIDNALKNENNSVLVHCNAGTILSYL